MCNVNLLSKGTLNFECGFGDTKVCGSDILSLNYNG